MTADLDVLEATSDGTRFDKVTAFLLGAVAILAAVLATLQIHASQAETRALLGAARLSVEVSEKIVGNTERETFGLHAVQRALTIGLQGTNRAIVAFQRPEQPVGQEAIGTADVAASERLPGIGARMADGRGEDSPVDPWTREVLNASIEEINAVVTEQNAQVDAAEAASARSLRAVLGLSLVALAGVMAGLTSVLGEGRAGRIALAVAELATAGAGLAAVTAIV